MSDYYTALTEHYKAVRSRLNAGPPPPWRQPVLPAPEPEPEPAQPPRTFGQWIAATDAMSEMFRDTLPIPTPIAAIAPSTARQIAREALAPHGMTWTEAMGPSRTLPYTNARKAVYAALRKHGWSLMKIGIFCGRDHTTIMNALHPKKDRLK
jgi:hypothetical protein